MKDLAAAIVGLPWWQRGKELTCQCRRRRRLGFDPWATKIWRRKRLPTPAFLPGKSHEQRSLVGNSPGGPKETDTTEHALTHLHLIYGWVLFVDRVSPRGICFFNIFSERSSLVFGFIRPTSWRFSQHSAEHSSFCIVILCLIIWIPC